MPVKSGTEDSLFSSNNLKNVTKIDIDFDTINTNWLFATYVTLNGLFSCWLENFAFFPLFFLA